MKKTDIPYNPLTRGADNLWRAADDLTQLADNGHHKWNGYGMVREMRTALNRATKAVERLERLAKTQREKRKPVSEDDYLRSL